MKSVKRKRYGSDFKAQAIELVSLGRAVPEVAQELGIGANILYRWTQQVRGPTQLGSAALRAGGEVGEADELGRLRDDNARLRLENDILKKAAVILGTQTPSRPAK
jgi:transposase